MRSITLLRSETRETGRHEMFCIRLHFVRKERIGIEKISTRRLLTIGESARRRAAIGSNHCRKKFQNGRGHRDRGSSTGASGAQPIRERA
ncbi:hypothetical protein [Bradyrhizobium sp. USDA 4486]